jgi:Na+/H+-dicarboxylate symporter
LVQLLLALALGGITGALVGARAARLGELAKQFIWVLRNLAMPLVFFAILDTLATHTVRPRRFLALLVLSGTNALVACCIALSLGHALPLGRIVDVQALRRFAERPEQASGHSIDVLWVIAAAIVVGLLLQLAKQTRFVDAVERAGALVHRLFLALMYLLRLVVRAVPLAAFGVMAKVVGTGQLAVLPVLGVFVLLVALAIALHVFGWYALVLQLVARTPPGAFFRRAGAPLATALATGSSLASLPVTLRTLEEEMGIQPESARLAAVVGTNLNHDGIILYEATAALFVAQVYGVDTSWAQQLTLVWIAVIAAIGIAGVPEAGLITLSLVLGRVGLPLGVVPVLLLVDWLLGRLRATANVASDMVVATVLDRRFTNGPDA